MRIFKTKYASMDDEALLKFADQNIDSLTELGRELLFRLEDILEDPESHPDMIKNLY